MGWKKDLSSLVVEVDILRIELATVRKSLLSVNAKLDLLTKTNQEQVTKMSDRLIEMAMVRQGFPAPASVHRNAARMEQSVEEPDNWTDDDKWPPKGHVAMNMP